ncbi:MAG TPA: tryptophan 2,3-dioxygenase family protein [Ktedonobacterales bacterium]|nr:tryptophan 2,3-dioxygenase family protein [Ktedonobacterales bacterium]
MSIDTPSKTTNQRQPTTYERYLRTDELLALQKPPAERLHRDELTFQVVHQTFELWWKLTVELMGRAGEELTADQPDEAARTLRRAVSAQDVVMPAIRQLEFVSPRDFLDIRPGLGDGSGGESPGFLGILRAAPDLWDAFAAALDRASVSLLNLYAHSHAHLALFECAEALTDFDEQFHLFRAAHLKLAQRNLGLRAIGTGGTPMPSLERTLRDLLFPALWEARDALLEATQREQGIAPSGPASGHGLS